MENTLPISPYYFLDLDMCKYCKYNSLRCWLQKTRQKIMAKQTRKQQKI